jgi:hypothetical protein
MCLPSQSSRERPTRLRQGEAGKLRRSIVRVDGRKSEAIDGFVRRGPSAMRKSVYRRCILSVRQAILRFRSGRSNHPIATDGASVWGWTPCTSVPTGQTRQRRLRRIRRQPSPQSTKSTMNVGPKRGLQLPLRPTANRFDSGHRRVRSPGDEVLEQEAAHLPNSRKCMKLHEYHGGRLPSARQTVPQLRPLPLRQWTRGLRCPPDMRGSLLRRCPGSRGDHPDRRT